jgi:hypothetical protein
MGPQHLVHWTRIAYAKDLPADLSKLDFQNTSTAEHEPVLESNSSINQANQQTTLDHSELRKLILEELRSLKDEI